MERPFSAYRQPLVIEAKSPVEGQKSRSFGAELLCLIVANRLWEMGSTARDNVLRPVFLAYAGTDQESRAFSENLRLGYPALCERGRASTSGLRIEIPRSAGFRFETYRQEGATLTLAYLPGPVSLLPEGGDDLFLRFLFLPPTWWVDREAATLPQLGSEAREAAVAAYFVAYLDQRSPLPIANDRLFHLALYRAALETSWCHRPDGTAFRPGSLYAEGHAGLGFESPLVVSTSRAEFSAFLAEQTARHLPRLHKEIAHGTPRVHRSCRLLPDAGRLAPAARLAR